MHQVIGILSGKGGVGKTSVAANIGAAITSDFKKDIVIVDTNTNTPHLGLHFGVFGNPDVTLREVVNRDAPVSRAVHTDPSTGTKTVPAALGAEKFNLTAQKLKNITKKLAREHELVILDCSPGLGKEVVTAISAMDAALIVTTPDFPAVSDALKTVRLLERMGKRTIGLIVNKKMGERYELTTGEIESVCGAKVVSIIPEDTRVPQGISEGVPIVALYPNSRASVAFKQLAARLIGQPYKSQSILEKIIEIFKIKNQTRRKI